MHHFRYLILTLSHKWGVFLLCCQFGIPWRGVIHDWSKFLPSEWGAHARYFGRPELMTQADKTALDRAWLFHQKRNKHHWQSWVAITENGLLSPQEIPERFCKEMLADWIERSRSRDGVSLAEWYEKKRFHMWLHPRTRDWIERRIREWGS